MDESPSPVPPRSKQFEHPLWGSLLALGLFVVFLLVWEYMSANRVHLSAVLSASQSNMANAHQLVYDDHMATDTFAYATTPDDRVHDWLWRGLRPWSCPRYSRGLYQVIDPIPQYYLPDPENLVATSGVGRLWVRDAPRQFIIAWALFFRW